MSKIYNLQDIPAELLATVGGKARGLNCLLKNGYRVPKGFVITDMEDNADFENAAEKYLADGFDSVSVRSSATLEDGNDYSAAGQFSTFLNVEGVENLKQAARDCVASLHNATAEQYAKTFMQSAKSRMTVIVQEMVDARCAGVIFSRAPMRPGFALVEAVPGLGENLVSGKMSAQQYRVREDKIEKMPENPLLSSQEALDLGAAARKAEQIFGKPMDLEWAIDQNGVIQWLQARPITIEEAVTMNELDCNKDVSHDVITTSNIGEVMPGAVTPLNLSTNMLSLDWGVYQTYKEIGCIPVDTPPYSFICSYYNHMFFNMSSMYTICHSAFGTTKESMDISICGHELKGYPDIDMPERSLLQKLRNTIIFMRFVTSGNRARKGMDRVMNKFHFDLSQDMHAIYQQILQNFKWLEWSHYYHYCTSYYSGGQSNILMTILEKDYANKTDLQSALAGCLTEIEDFESANVLRMMRSLAKTILRYHPGAEHYDVQQLADFLDHQASEEVRTEYNAFMAKHGHRGIREMEIRCPSWKANKESFCSSLLSVIASSRQCNCKSDKSWIDYANEMLKPYNRLKKKMLWSFIHKARKGVCFREYTKSKVVYALDLFKQAYAKLAELMVEAKLLPDADCIYFLLQNEVGELLKGDMSLVKKALARRRLFAQQMDLKFPEVTMGVPQPLVAQKSNPNATSFQGTPVSRGTVSGKARIVRTETDAHQLENGEIMVAMCTDIGWTPYYNIIGGLVTEIGSALSHGIVVAREYALPSVVNVSNAMQEIHTGDLLTLDGNTGMIYIEKRAE